LAPIGEKVAIVTEELAGPGIRSEHAAPQAGRATAAVSYHLPPEPLRAAVTSYYLVRVEGEGLVTDQIFPEWTNFRLILSGAWSARFPDRETEPVPPAGVTGALERAVWVTGSPGLLVGVGLLPQGWPMFTAQAAVGFANCMRPLSDALGPAADDLFRDLTACRDEAAIFATLDRALLPMLREAPEAALVASAHAALQDPQLQTVTDWAEAVGLSPRQLERFCLRYLGLPPKRLLRRQRVLRSLAAMNDQPDAGWSHSIDEQFTDQAHFIREFKHYMGQSPRAYLARHRPFMAEAWKRRKAVLGAPVQVLQPPTEPG
jgi:AraC-like DNA-binding protein